MGDRQRNRKATAFRGVVGLGNCLSNGRTVSVPRQCGRRGGHPSRRIMRTTRRSSLPRCKRGGSGSARTAVHECCGSADDAEVVPPDGLCGRHGGHPSRAANGEGPPPRGPQCMSAVAIRTTRRSSLPRIMRTTRRSSLPTDHAGVVISGSHCLH